jgi:hypothetical protein
LPNRKIDVIPRNVNNQDYNVKLRDLAGAKGLDVGWDDKTRTVSIGGQPFDTTGWQNIGGYHMGTEAMANDFLSNYQVPSGNMPTANNSTGNTSKFAIPNYDPSIPQGHDVTTPKYSNEINNLTNQLGSAVQNFGKPYDLSSDPIYQQLAEYQRGQMLQMANRRGMAMSSETMARIDQSDKMLGLQFQDRHDARQLQNIQNLQGQLGTMTGLEDRAMKRDNALYGMDLSPQTRDYMNIMQGLSQEQRQFINQYSNDFASVINQMSPDDPNRKVFEAARFQKVISDPVQFRDYLINDYGMSPFQVDNIVINRQIEQMQAQAKNEKEAMELQRLMLQVEKAFLDNEKAGFDIQKAGIDVERAGVGLAKDEIDAQKAYWDTVMAQIKASALPQQLKAELENTMARTRSTNMASQLTQQKLNELTVDVSEGVKDGFQDLVRHMASGSGDILSWFNSTAVWDENKRIERKVTDIYTTKELEGVIKLATQSKLLGSENKTELDKLNEFMENMRKWSEQ